MKAVHGRDSLNNSKLGAAPRIFDRKRHCAVETTACFVVGLATGLLLVAWRRRCIQITGTGTDITYSTTLVALAGLGIGFACGPVLAKFIPSRLLRFPQLILAIIGASVLGQQIAPVLNLTTSGLVSLRSSILANLSICCAVSVSLQFLPTFVLGLLFRLFEKECRPHPPGSMVYSAGGVAIGLWAGSRWALPACGLNSVMVIGLGLLAFILPLMSLQKTLSHPSILIPLSLAGVLIFEVGKLSDSEFRYGDAQPEERKSEFFRMGVSGDVRVCLKNGERSLQFNGIEIGGTGLSLPGELGLACLPRLLRPAAKNVLLVGLGTAAATRASCLFPCTRVVCVETEPAILCAKDYFTQVGGSKLVSPASATIVEQDANDIISNYSEPIDLILVNYGDLRLDNTSRFLNKKFCSLAKKALSPSGILAEKLQLDTCSAADLALIARTILSVFPHATLAMVSNSQAIVLASGSPLIDSANSVLRSQMLVNNSKAIRDVLERGFGSGSVSGLLLTHLWLGEQGFRQLGRRDAELGILSGWNWQMSSPFSHFRQGEQDRRVVDGLLEGSMCVPEFEHMLHEFGAGASTKACHEVASRLAGSGQLRCAFSILSIGLAQDPGQGDLLADRLIWSNETDPEIIAASIARMDGSSVDALNRIGVSLWQRHRFHLAILVFEHLTNLIPESASAWANLATNYKASGDFDKASECAARAIELDPVNEFVRRLQSNMVGDLGAPSKHF